MQYATFDLCRVRVDLRISCNFLTVDNICTPDYLLVLVCTIATWTAQNGIWLQVRTKAVKTFSAHVHMVPRQNSRLTEKYQRNYDHRPWHSGFRQGHYVQERSVARRIQVDESNCRFVQLVHTRRGVLFCSESFKYFLLFNNYTYEYMYIRITVNIRTG